MKSDRRKTNRSPMESAAAFRVGAVYIGCFLGAGFLSGQELFQFFGSHGMWGIAGLFLAVLLFILLGILVLRLVADSGLNRMDTIVIWFPCRGLRAAVAGFEVIFLFVIYLLMTAAAGALGHQLLGCLPLFGSAAFCLLTTCLSVLGIRGLIRVFSGLTPVLVLVTLSVCGIAVFSGGDLNFSSPSGTVGLVSGNWILDAVIYVAFGTFCAIPVLVPLGRMVPNGRAVRKGILGGGLALLALAMGILLALAAVPESAEAALPMLEIAFLQSRAIGWVFGILLFCGIFSAGLSSQSAMNEYFFQRFPKRKKLVCVGAAAASLCSLFFSTFGFRSLIGVLYPILGYIGLIPLLFLLIHAVVFYRPFKRKKTNGSDSDK